MNYLHFTFAFIIAADTFLIMMTARSTWRFATRIPAHKAKAIFLNFLATKFLRFPVFVPLVIFAVGQLYGTLQLPPENAASLHGLIVLSLVVSGVMFWWFKSMCLSLRDDLARVTLKEIT